VRSVTVAFRRHHQSVPPQSSPRDFNSPPRGPRRRLLRVQTARWRRRVRNLEGASLKSTQSQAERLLPLPLEHQEGFGKACIATHLQAWFQWFFLCQISKLCAPSTRLFPAIRTAEKSADFARGRSSHPTLLTGALQVDTLQTLSQNTSPPSRRGLV